MYIYIYEHICRKYYICVWLFFGFAKKKSNHIWGNRNRKFEPKKSINKTHLHWNTLIYGITWTCIEERLYSNWLAFKQQSDIPVYVWGRGWLGADKSEIAFVINAMPMRASSASRRHAGRTAMATDDGHHCRGRFCVDPAILQKSGARLREREKRKEKHTVIYVMDDCARRDRGGTPRQTRRREHTHI